MTKTPWSLTRAALASLSVVAALGLASCDTTEQETNAAAKPVELARYLPKNTQFVQAVDVVKAREELELPEDANALPTSYKTFPRAKSPELELFVMTSNAYPDVRAVFANEFNGRGASPLDGTLIRAAAGDGNASIVSTAEPTEDIERKLKLAGYSTRGKFYVAGEKTVAPSRFVADAGSGRFVFAAEEKDAQEILRRIRNDASPGEAADALEPAAGSVRLALTNDDKRSCVTAFSAAMEATGEGAALVLIISGDKPDPDRFDPKSLKGLATGKPTVLVDALIVPIRVKKPLRDGLNALEQVLGSHSKADVVYAGRHTLKEIVPAPFKSYDCP